MKEFLDLLQTFGLAVGMLVVMGLFAWRALIWLKPWAERIIESHIKLVTTTADTVEKLGDAQMTHEKTLSQIARTQQQQAELQSQMLDKLTVIGETVSEHHQFSREAVQEFKQYRPK